MKNVRATSPGESVSIPVNPFIPSGFFYLNSLDRSISYRRGVWLLFIITMFIEIYVFNAHSVDPDQTPLLRRLIWVYTVCLCPFLWDARLKWVKFN